MIEWVCLINCRAPQSGEDALREKKSRDVTGAANAAKREKGFTIAEMLITVLILLMVSSIVAGGIPLAAKALEKVVDASNAHVLLSTTMTCLRDELSTADAASITVSADKKSITYMKSDGSRSLLESCSDGIWLYPYQDFYSGGSEGSVNEAGETVTNPYARPLVSEKSSGEKLHTDTGTVFEYEYNESSHSGIVTVSGLAVKKGTSGSPIAEIGEFKIRVIWD